MGNLGRSMVTCPAVALPTALVVEGVSRQLTYDVAALACLNDANVPAGLSVTQEVQGADRGVLVLGDGLDVTPG